MSEFENEEQIVKIASGQKNFVPAKKGKKAENGDQVVIDFLGKVDGEPFEGGAAQDTPLELGAGRFIPGFEDGIKGARAGEERVVKATFPAENPVKTLAGKEAIFDVKVKSVEAPKVRARPR